MGRYEVSKAGSDWTRLRVLAADSGADAGDVVAYPKFVLPKWSPDSSQFQNSAAEIACLIRALKAPPCANQ